MSYYETTFQVWEVDADGDRVSQIPICTMRDKRTAIDHARTLGLKRFNVMQESESPDGCASQCVHMER